MLNHFHIRAENMRKYEFENNYWKLLHLHLNTFNFLIMYKFTN